MTWLAMTESVYDLEQLKINKKELFIAKYVTVDTKKREYWGDKARIQWISSRNIGLRLGISVG